MRGNKLALGLGTMLTLLAGCATHTGTGMTAGGLLGAATGALIGSRTGDAGTGALIGAGLGAATGGLIGAGLDENDRRNAERIAAVTAPGPLTISDIVQMTRSGVSDDTIISSIRSSGAVFNLTAADVVSLHNQGVSDRVIQAMLDTARRPAVFRRSPVIYERRVIYEPAPVYIVEPAPPGFSFGIG